MTKHKTRREQEKKYIRNILTCHLGGDGKASRRVACKRAMVLDGSTIRKKLLTRQLGGWKE